MKLSVLAITQKRTCSRCAAMEADRQDMCELGYSQDRNVSKQFPTPLEPCPKPVNKSQLYACWPDFTAAMVCGGVCIK